ncbi:MFS transporter, partial [Actinotignum sp. GS-2025f]|uniref:MFS transporter n=1 Tax=Actinotignum sp. GS-2025f TaxID=3427279 RepID=UPI003F47F620
ALSDLRKAHAHLAIVVDEYGGTDGIAGDAAFASSILVGLTNLAFTLLGRSLVDKVGRRPLVTLGAGIDLVALLAIAGIFYFNGSELSTTTGIIVLVLIIVFIAALAVGIGSVLWVFISEIFPPAHRANGQAVGSAAHWVSAAIISGTFPVMFQASMTFTFLFYAACMLGAVIWSRTMMPETKGTLLEDV